MCELGWSTAAGLPLLLKRAAGDCLDVQAFRLSQCPRPGQGAWPPQLESLPGVTQLLACTRQVVVIVVGAGRGPLVRASLSAARATGRRVRVWAVEKNVNAVVHLWALVAAEGCAARAAAGWQPERVDITADAVQHVPQPERDTHDMAAAQEHVTAPRMT